MDEPTSVEVTVSAPGEVVWRWLRDPDLVEQWHGWQAPGLADRIRRTFLDGAVEDATQLRVEMAGGDTLVALPQGDRAMVRVVRGSETAAPDDAAPDDEVTDDEVTESWRTFLQ